MKKALLSLVMVFALMPAFAQWGEVVKDRVNTALTEHLRNITPPRGSECDACAYTYNNSLKIERTQEVDGKLLIYGKAKTKFTSKFSGSGEKIVDFYAELIKPDNVVTVTKLKWSNGPTMRLTEFYSK